MWELKYSKMFIKQARKLDQSIIRRISDYLDEVVLSGDPYSRGKPLVGDRQGYWRYRVADYRIIVEVVASELVVIAVEVGHRKDIYK